jgi:gamma-glutamyltranspeptidase/glutathione hydrolase
MLTVCVVMPFAVGIAGYGGSMVIYLAKENRTIALDFDSRAPLAYRDELFMSKPELAQRGYLSVGVPGVLAGLAEAHRKYGTMPWSDLCQHAIKMAEEGIVIDADFRDYLGRWQKFVDPVSFKALMPSGKMTETGERLFQKDHARLLRRIAKDGAGVMYHGEIAAQIIRQVHDHGGILSEEDMSTYKPLWTDPISINYRGFDVYTPPPPSGGITSLQILKTLEFFQLGKMKPWSAEYFHHFAEASKLCWQDRARAVGDPDFVKIPYDWLLSEESARIKADRIKRGGIVSGDEKLPPGSSHTANVCAADREGNIVSTTCTQGYLFGSGVVIEGLGLIVGHGMSRFDMVPGHPNAPAPGKRMHHNMAPAIVIKDGKPVFAVGLPGGPKIVSVTAQMIMNVIDFHATAEETVVAPRVHTEIDEPVAVSSKVSDEIIEELKAMGHQVRRGQDVGGAPTEVAGRANAIVYQGDSVSAASGRGPAAAAVVEL